MGKRNVSVVEKTLNLQGSDWSVCTEGGKWRLDRQSACIRLSGNLYSRLTLYKRSKGEKWKTIETPTFPSLLCVQTLIRWIIGPQLDQWRQSLATRTDPSHISAGICAPTCRTVLGTVFTKVTSFNGENPSALNVLVTAGMTKVPIFACLY